MPTIFDDEFGEIVISRQALAKNISARVAPDGRLRISTPSHISERRAKSFIQSARLQIRQLLNQHNSLHAYTKSQSIGKSHHLRIERTTTQRSAVTMTGTHITALVAADENIMSPKIQSPIKAKIIVALRKEAKAYLPRRLKYLAEQHGFVYSSVKITHASSRWGSCSSRGTISLNIGLMNLPFALLDYVLLHELSHTRQMNHSEAFWQQLAAIDPSYKIHRSALGKYTPHI